MSEPTQDKVHVVDDDPNDLILICRWLEDLGLQTQGYASAQAFLSDPHSRACACLVLDVRMPKVDGLELQKQLVAEGWTGATIFLTGLNDAPSAVCAVKDLQAEHYILKPSGLADKQEFLDCIMATLEKQRSLQQENRQRIDIEQHIAALSGREKQILDLIVRGQLNKQIAEQLGISTRTVEFHRANIMRRLGATSTAGLVRLVLEISGGTQSNRIKEGS